MAVLEVKYAGGLDVNTPFNALAQVITEAGFDLPQPENETKAKQVEDKLTQAGLDWALAREPWLDVVIHDLGEHNVTPIEMQDGEWVYMLHVDTENTARLVRSRRHQAPVIQQNIAKQLKGKLSNLLNSHHQPSDEFVTELTPESVAIIPDVELLVFEPEKYRRVYSFLQLDNDSGEDTPVDTPKPKKLVPVS